MKKPDYIEIPFTDPARLFENCVEQRFAQFLDSSAFDPQQGRYSFIATDPIATFKEECVTFETLRNNIANLGYTQHEGLPPFQGGFLGYFGYELLHHIEKIPAQSHDNLSLPDMCIGFYDVVAAFDHEQEKAWIFSMSGVEKAEDFKSLLFKKTSTVDYTPIKTIWQSDFTRDEYVGAVQNVIDYIKAGDIFQANLTQRFTTNLPEQFDTYAFYKNLRKVNPALFSAYLKFEDFCIASSSPERFLKLENNHVETRPIKGTRPRNTDLKIDKANAVALSNSEKDRAENTMIVDLLRNDISRVCKPHSVEVPELCGIHSFASVHHLVSTVTGELEEEKDTFDLLKACFPGGSITGAPKVRAMEIISELEKCRRNIYCGAIGYIALDGTMDTNIVIRTAIIKDDTACVQVGGGIVADSKPEAEYQETLDKAQALFKAFEEVAP